MGNLLRSLVALGFLAAVLSGCSVNSQSSSAGSGGSSQVLPSNNNTSLTVKLGTGSSASSEKYGSVITVTSNQIIGATITLLNGDNGYSTNWAPGSASSFTFQALTEGNYTLTVTDWDTAGHTNTAEAAINIEYGYNYSITVQLGGVVYINLEATYIVSFDNQGATTLSNPASISVTLPATNVGNLPVPPAKAGYVFGGWYTSTNGGGSQFNASSLVTSNQTVYAYWIPIYTVTYNSEGGSPVDAQTVTFPADSVASLPANPFLAGSTFAGWYSAPGQAGSLFTVNTQVTSNITVYAYWIPNLAAEYLLNGNASDTSGNGNNGTLYNVSFTSDRFGNAGGAAHFAGNQNSYINCSANLSNYLSSQISVSFWFRTGTYYDQPILGKYGNDLTGGFRFDETADGHIYFGIANGADHFLTNSGPALSLNTYHHIAGVYNQLTGFWAIYIDGVATVGPNYTTGSLNYVPQATNPDCANFEIGRHWAYGLNYEKEPVDVNDLRVYNRALSSSEIETLYSIISW